MRGWWHRNEALEREIDAELEFHVAEATDELVAAGVPVEEARGRALAQLGDLERWRAQCLRQREGVEPMLMKLQWAAIALLGGALVAICLRWQHERERHTLQLEGAFWDLAESRQALADAQLAREVGESLARSMKSHDGRAIQVEVVGVSQLDRRELAELTESVAALPDGASRPNVQWVGEVDFQGGRPSRRFHLRMVVPPGK